MRSNRIRRATSERVTLVPIFYAIKNQSPTPLFLLFAKKCRSTRLLACTALVSLAIADNFFAVTGFAPQSTVFDCGACFFVVSLARRTHRCVSNRIRRATSERVTLVPIFYAIKNQSPTPLFLLFAKKCRSTRLLACTVLVSLAFADNFFCGHRLCTTVSLFDCGACFFVVSLARRTHPDRICNLPAEML